MTETLPTAAAQLRENAMLWIGEHRRIASKRGPRTLRNSVLFLSTLAGKRELAARCFRAARLVDAGACSRATVKALGIEGAVTMVHSR